MAGFISLDYVQSVAELWNPHGGKPVNDGERRVIAALVDQLPDGFKVIPSLEVRYADRNDEIDAIVVGPDVVVLIETKDYAGNVVFREQNHTVNGAKRPHPVDGIGRKAKRFKGKLSDSSSLLKQVWVSSLVVLAREPRNLHVDPVLERSVCDVAGAVARLTDPGRILPSGAQPTEVPVDLVLQALGIYMRARRGSLTLGPYRTTSLVEEDAASALYEAEEIVTELPYRLRVHRIDPFLPKDERDEIRKRALRAYRALTDLEEQVGHVEQVVGPVSAFPTDNGDIVIVSTVEPDPTLRDLDVD
jgi:hypothetical protein